MDAPPAEGGPLAHYRALVASGALRADSAQAKAAGKLESLHRALEAHVAERDGAGWRARLRLPFSAREPFSWSPAAIPSSGVCQGLYLFGPVGSGKSMLMDLFFASAPVAAKRRAHFHEFMRDAHAAIHRWRRKRDAGDADPIPPLARSIAREAGLLCFDELQVTDIADAMILGRLFEALFREGVVTVITSNRHPDLLYKDGLQRERFLPFIGLIKSRLDITEVSGGTDYRLGGAQGGGLYLCPGGAAAERALAAHFDHLTDGAPAGEEAIEVLNRTWRVPKAANKVAWFAFDALCRSQLGPADYLALAARYHCVIVSDVPRLSAENRDAARRFVTLIDALYEARVMFICSAAAPAEDLYPDGDGAFEFRRTASRLIEMQSERYIAERKTL
jgi:cell division protein ZapE